MNSTDIRRMKLVSRDMKYLIERSGRHLTKQNMHDLVLDLVVAFSQLFTNLFC
uniref:Dynein light chain n=1 Tax=Heterorhabditis bacteriophora TaxID=37862 RepID=A0A1I7WHD3_HETBA